MMMRVKKRISGVGRGVVARKPLKTIVQQQFFFYLWMMLW
jgi:hypothetical protein